MIKIKYKLVNKNKFVIKIKNDCTNLQNYIFLAQLEKEYYINII